MQAQASRRAGFTIVELLVVIVVIGVLAAITIVSYSGIAKQATVASLKSDLTNAARQLKVFQVDNGYYPTSINTCPATADAMCLKPSKDNIFDEYARPTSQSFTLRAKNGNSIFLITENTPPTEVAPLTAIASVSGTAQVGSTLTAGALTPTGATATYQWQRADTSGGSYANISGATSSTYTPVMGDASKYLRVVATGSRSYWSSVTSTPSSAILQPPYVFLSGGAIVDSGSTRTHTFSPGTYTLTASASGTIAVTINGAGGGGGGGEGPDDDCSDSGVDGGTGGTSSVSYSSVSYAAYAGTGGGSGGIRVFGVAGGTNNPSGWTSTTGGGAAGGAGGGGALYCYSGRSGGSGGRLTGSLTVASGTSLTVSVGSGGSAGAAAPDADDGSAGSDGSVAITYTY